MDRWRGGGVLSIEKIQTITEQNKRKTIGGDGCQIIRHFTRADKVFNLDIITSNKYCAESGRSNPIAI